MKRGNNIIKQAFLLAITAFSIGFQSCTKVEPLNIIYPFEGTLYPKDIAPPNFVWKENNQNAKSWSVSLYSEDEIIIERFKVKESSWKPTKETWNKITDKTNNKYTIKIEGYSKGKISEGMVSFSVSSDPVQAPIFFRSVPLPFKFARENMKKLLWHFGSISNETKPHRIMYNIPVCANCHSFSDDGKTIGMDVDAMNDKGAYVMTDFTKETEFSNDKIIAWDKSQNGAFTYGLLSKMSPDGRYSISTLGDCEIFIPQNDLEISQLFFPFKGILMVYDRHEKEFFPLEGACDTNLVQTNPVWTPDGKKILFARARAKHYEESGIQHGSSPKPKDKAQYKKFEQTYVKRDSLFKFDIYTVQFNNGKGGIAKPLTGASHNGMSNYFPRVSPDGKWIVYSQAESFMFLQKDSKLWIVPAEGGKPRKLTCNQDKLNSWHSWSPNSKWLVFSTKRFGAYTQLFLTHIDENGNDSPPVFLDNFSFHNYANNIPEFVNTEYNPNQKIEPVFLSEDDFLIREGEILQEKGFNEQAYRSFSKALEKFPNSADAYYKRGFTSYELNHLDLALDDLNKAITIEKKADYYYTRARIKMKMNDSDAAVTDFDEAIKFDPSDFKPYSKLGVIFFNQQKYDLAVQNFDKAVNLNIADYFSHFNLAIIKYRQKQLEEAKKVFHYQLSIAWMKSFFQTCLKTGQVLDRYGRILRCYFRFAKSYFYRT